MKLKTLQKRGQVETGKNFIFAILGLGIALAFFLVFQGNLFNIIPSVAPTGSFEANGTTDIRKNLTITAGNVTQSLPNLGSLGVLVLVIGALALAWAFFSRSNIIGGGSGSY